MSTVTREIKALVAETEAQIETLSVEQALVAGLTKVSHLGGGLVAWSDAGAPVESPAPR